MVVWEDWVVVATAGTVLVAVGVVSLVDMGSEICYLELILLKKILFSCRAGYSSIGFSCLTHAIGASFRVVRFP